MVGVVMGGGVVRGGVVALPEQKNFWGPVGWGGWGGWVVGSGCGGGWGGSGGRVVRCGRGVDGVWTQTVKAKVVNGFRRAPFGEPEAKIPNVLVLFLCGCLHFQPLFDCYCAGGGSKKKKYIYIYTTLI